MNHLSRLVSLALAVGILLSCGGGTDETSGKPEAKKVGSLVQAQATVACETEGLVIGIGPGSYQESTDSPILGLPDFYVESLKTTDGRYAFLQTETIQIHAIIGNDGDADWDNGTRDDMYVMLLLSKGSEEDAHSDWKNVGMQQIQKGNIDVGTHKDEYFSVNLATLNNGLALAPGKYNFVVCADRKEEQDNGDGEVLEKHKSNNCSTELVFDVLPDPNYVEPKPNLVPYAFGFIQTPTYAGDFARFAASIRNQGNFKLPADIRSTYSVSCNGNAEIVLTDDGTAADELEPGESMTEATDSPVQLPTTPGTCTAYFRVDTGGVAAESDENDNVASFTFTLLPRPQPDLVITYVGIGDSNDTSIKKGSKKHPTMRIKNIGSGPVMSGIYNYYFWCTTSLQCSFIDGDNTEAHELCVGCEMKERIDWDWSASKKGTFYLKVCTDVNEQQPESDETNNCRLSSPITVK